jgi:hypothetical protein
MIKFKQTVTPRYQNARYIFRTELFHFTYLPVIPILSNKLLQPADFWVARRKAIYHTSTHFIFFVVKSKSFKTKTKMRSKFKDEHLAGIYSIVRGYPYTLFHRKEETRS